MYFVVHILCILKIILAILHSYLHLHILHFFWGVFKEGFFAEVFPLLEYLFKWIFFSNEPSWANTLKPDIFNCFTCFIAENIKDQIKGPKMKRKKTKNIILWHCQVNMRLLCLTLSNLDQMNDSMLSVTEAFRFHIYGSQCLSRKYPCNKCLKFKAPQHSRKSTIVHISFLPFLF